MCNGFSLCFRMKRSWGPAHCPSMSQLCAKELDNEQILYLNLGIYFSVWGYFFAFSFFFFYSLKMLYSIQNKKKKTYITIKKRKHIWNRGRKRKRGYSLSVRNQRRLCNRFASDLNICNNQNTICNGFTIWWLLGFCRLSFLG